jgi:hypothetical protein
MTPSFIEPCLNWNYEIKHDGYRVAKPAPPGESKVELG